MMSTCVVSKYCVSFTRSIMFYRLIAYYIHLQDNSSQFAKSYVSRAYVVLVFFILLLYHYTATCNALYFVYCTLYTLCFSWNTVISVCMLQFSFEPFLERVHRKALQTHSLNISSFFMPSPIDGFV